MCTHSVSDQQVRKSTDKIKAWNLAVCYACLLYTSIDTAFTYLNKETELFKVVNVPFIDDLKEYCELALKTADEQKEYFTGPLGNDVFQCSPMPWVTYTHISHTNAGTVSYTHLFPQKLSNYFFFDGERWNKSKDKTSEIKQSINTILGVSSLIKMKEHFKDGNDSYRTSVLKKLRGDIKGSSQEVKSKKDQIAEKTCV